MLRRSATFLFLIIGLLFAGYAVLGAAQAQVQAPSLTVIPSSGPRGTSITIIGENFTSNGSVANGIAIDGVSTGNELFTLTTDGRFVANNVVVLAAGPGSKTVSVADSGGLAGSAIFTLTKPTVTLSPTTATMGEVVTITGAGWVPLSTVFITMDSNYLEVASIAATANATGGFETTMKLPSAVGIGSKVVSFDAADISYLGNTAITQDLTVPAPNVTLSATEAAVGSIVTLEASGFTPHSALTDLSIGGLDVWEGVPITDSIGSLTVPFKVPGLIGGQLVLVSIGGTTISKALIVKNTIVPPLPQPTPQPAPQPALATPAVEVFADLIANGNNLIRVFRFENSTQTWEFFDPRPEFAAANNLTNTVAGEIVWVNVSSGQEFQGQTLVAGWNLFSLK